MLNLFIDQYYQNGVTPTDSQLELQSFINSTVELAESCVIKFNCLAEELNAQIANYVTVNADPVTWKYYLNLAGEYHDLDIPLYITSFDDGTEILFSKPVLESHPFTKRRYGYGTTDYYELIKHNPRHETIIKGIVLGIDLADVLNAPDHSIVGYDSTKLEAHEYGLITYCNQWLSRARSRWYTPAYPLIDGYYNIGYTTLIQLHLSHIILSRRESRQGTREVHSFYIRQRLLSNGLPRRIVDLLPFEASLFLYRNIRYIRKYQSSDQMHQWITDKLLHSYGIYVADLFLAEGDRYEPNDGQMKATIVQKPRVTVPVNPMVESLESFESRTRVRLAKKDNPLEFNTKPLFDYSLTNQLRTKMVYIDDRVAASRLGISHQQFILDQWVTAAIDGDYQYDIRILLPKSNDTITVTPLDAFTLWVYVYYRSIGKRFMRTPAWLCRYATNHSTHDPAVVLFNSVLPSIDIALRDKMIADYPFKLTFLNTDQFSTYADSRYVAYVSQLAFAQMQTDPHLGFYWTGVANYPYGERAISLANNDFFETWVARLNVDLEDLSQDDYRQLADEIYRQATGFEPDRDELEHFIKRSLVDATTLHWGYTVRPLLNDYSKPWLVGTTPLQTTVTFT